MHSDSRDHHQKLLQQLERDLAGNTKRLRVKKKTISNLFRYTGRQNLRSREVDLSQFNKPLYLDSKNLTLEVQGLATYESIVDFVLPLGFAPKITPELKHITIGGATVGIGIEANSYKFGFVHNDLIEADVLLPDGKIVTCSADNAYADLFHGLPNSYGTLGYILRAKIKLRKAKPYMTLKTERFNNPTALLAAAKAAADDPLNDVIEGLAYAKNELYLTIGRETSTANHVTGIYGNTIFYKEISRPGKITLTAKDYLFRYDPEWFWNVPESGFFQMFRIFAPPKMRNSAFYTRYTKISARLPFLETENPQEEQLIQDWEVPWRHAYALLDFVLDTVDLNSKPLEIVLVKVPKSATCYPIKEKQLYLNIGSYSFVKKKASQQDFYHTKVIDDFCFKHDGIKMLYSTTFLSKSKFDKIYNGEAYEKLKKKYDPLGLTPTLFEKAVQSH